MRRTAVFLVALGALALGACGDDDGGDDVSEEERPYVDALAAQFTSGEDGEMQLTGEQADCVAPRWVSTIGVERFEEAGVAPEDITDPGEDELTQLGLGEDDGNELYDAFEACDVDVPGLLIGTLQGDLELPDDVVDCLEGELDADLVRELMVVTVTEGDEALAGDSEVAQRFGDAITGCLPDEG